MNYGTATQLSPQQVLQAGERFFGPGGLGLEVQARAPDRLEFAGLPGTVSLRVQVTDRATEAFLATDGLDAQVRRFMVEIYEQTHPERREACSP